MVKGEYSSVYEYDLTGLSDSMINMAGIFMDLFIGLVVAIYLLYGRRKFKKQGKLLLYSLFKARWADKIIEEIRFADRVFSGFIAVSCWIQLLSAVFVILE